MFYWVKMYKNKIHIFRVHKGPKNQAVFQVSRRSFMPHRKILLELGRGPVLRVFFSLYPSFLAKMYHTQTHFSFTVYFPWPFQHTYSLHRWTEEVLWGCGVVLIQGLQVCSQTTLTGTKVLQADQSQKYVRRSMVKLGPELKALMLNSTIHKNKKMFGKVQI